MGSVFLEMTEEFADLVRSGKIKLEVVSNLESEHGLGLKAELISDEEAG